MGQDAGAQAHAILREAANLFPELLPEYKKMRDRHTVPWVDELARVSVDPMWEEAILLSRLNGGAE